MSMLHRIRYSLLPLVLVAASAVSLFAEGQVTSLAVYPPDIHLTSQQDLQRFIVVATRDDGVTVDVTKTAAIALKDPNLATIQENVLYPQADGATTLEATVGNLSASATVEIQHATTERPISFQMDVMPVFMRAGCNTGSCHGSARGKDGFRLSLFGFDPRGDYFRLTREIGVRRVNLAIPEKSLLIEKTTGAVPHTGGKLFEQDSDYCQALLQWLQPGAPDDAAEPPAVVGVDLYPPSAVIEGEKSQQLFIARARYSDGTDRDVTNLAVFNSNNGNSATISKTGLVEAAARGEAFVTARFDTVTVGSQVLVLPKDLQYTPPAITGNYIDQLVGAKLKRLRILPSEICSDEEFLRRVTLDITGLLPTEEQYEAFMADADPAKRAKLVDALLERKEFAEIWAMKWAELLMVKSSNQVSYKAMFLYSNWLTNKIASGVPLDQMVRELAECQRRHLQEPGDELLSDRARHAQDGRERGAGLHGNSNSVCAMSQPPVRSLDDGRLLQFCRVLQPDWPQAGGGLPRDDRLQQRWRRSAASGDRPGDAAQVSWRRRTRPARAGSSGRDGPMADVARESLLFDQCGESHLGALLWRRDRRSGGRYSRQQSGQQPGAVCRVGAEAGRVQVRFQAIGARHLQLACVPAQRRAE